MSAGEVMQWCVVISLSVVFLSLALLVLVAVLKETRKGMK